MLQISCTMAPVIYLVCMSLIGPVAVQAFSVPGAYELQQQRSLKLYRLHVMTKQQWERMCTATYIHKLASELLQGLSSRCIIYANGFVEALDLFTHKRFQLVFEL